MSPEPDHCEPPLGTAQVLSPLKNLVESAVPLPSRAAGVMPLPRFEALRAVRFAPEATGKMAGKRASGSVPDDKSLALRVVISASDEVFLFICPLLYSLAAATPAPVRPTPEPPSPPLAGTAQVLSPLKNLVESAVPLLPSRAIGTVPLPRFEALRAVMFAPGPEID